MEHLLEYQQPQIQLNQYARICCHTRLLLSKVRGFAFAALILNTEHADGEIPSSFVRIAGLLKPMNRTLLVMIVSLVALLALVGLLATGDRDLESGPIKLYCAASNRAVMESIKAQYEEEIRAKGYTVIIDYGPSQMELFDYKPGLDTLRGSELPDSIRQGQRLTGMTAPWVLDGPMCGDTFQVYVRDVLAPTFRRGDVVVLDNLFRPFAGSVLSLPGNLGVHRRGVAFGRLVAVGAGLSFGGFPAGHHLLVAGEPGS